MSAPPTSRLTSNRLLVGLTILSFVIASPGLRATCIVVVRTRTGLYLAADSKQTDRTGASRSACKILEGKGFYWGASSPFYADSTTGFDVEKLAGTVGGNGTLLDKMNVFLSHTRNPLATEIASIRGDDPDLFDKIVTGKKSPLEIVFVATEKERSTFVWANFTARLVGNGIKVDGHPTPAPEPDTDRPSAALGLGEYLDAMTYLNSHGGSLLNDPVATLRESVLLEERTHGAIVGGAVSVLHLQANTATWIDKGECR